MSEQSRNRLVGMKVQSLCFFSPIATYIALYFYVSSTVKRKNQYTDFLKVCGENHLEEYNELKHIKYIKNNSPWLSFEWSNAGV